MTITRHDSNANNSLKMCMLQESDTKKPKGTCRKASLEAMETKAMQDKNDRSTSSR